MPPRRRASLSRSPILRTMMWDSKMTPETYSKQLKATKPLALPKVAEYQSVHEYLISIVKSIASRYNEHSITQEYMWYAQGIWKALQKYSASALQKEVDSLFIYYLLKGRNEATLRGIALALGIKISDTQSILENLMVTVGLQVIAKGTIVTDGTEQTILEYTGAISTIQGYIDLSNMQEGDQAVVRVYVKIRPDGDYVLYHSQICVGKYEAPALYLLPRLSGYAFKVTIEHKYGYPKNFDYIFTKGTG